MTNSNNLLSMESSFIDKSLFGLRKAVTSPRSTISWIFRGHLARDGVFINQTYWFTGSLPRVPLNQVFPGIQDVDVSLPRAFDRKSGKTASISVEEASNLAAIVRHRKVRRALEIGTSDGNTALVLAANLADDGRVVTVDLPPDFAVDQQHSLVHSSGELNLTPRSEVGRQYCGHRLAPRIKQIYGDSARLNWAELGGPFDLVFIDGSHTEAYVESDSRNAFEHLAPGGVIVWHDYGMIPAVSTVVDRIARDMTAIQVVALEGTRLAVGLR